MIKYDESMIGYVKKFATEDEVSIINDYMNSMEIVFDKDVFYIDQIESEHSDHRQVIDQTVIDTVRKLENRIRNYIENMYFPDAGLEIDELTWTRGLELVRWLESSVLAPHADGSSDAPEFPIINLGALIYLNNEYEGGEIKFNDYDIEFKPNVGDLVIFPNHYIHEVLIVKKKDPVTRRHTMPVFYSFRTKEQ
jgi:hypothetical protein